MVNVNYCNELTDLLKYAEGKYYAGSLEYQQIKSKILGVWYKTLSVRHDITKDIPQTSISPNHYMGATVSQTIFLKPVTPYGLLKIINSIQKNMVPQNTMALLHSYY